eukprot:scaffold29_cov251-Pinguiococcus_pyrenoidosus.AAC.25
MNASIYPQYQDMDWQEDETNFGARFLTFVVLYYNVVTISLYITIEIVVRFMMHYIDWDKEMYYAPLDLPAKARSTNVTDLGQIQYIFSDKTGTLTQNVMTFRCVSIMGRVFGTPLEELFSPPRATVDHVDDDDDDDMAPKPQLSKEVSSVLSEYPDMPDVETLASLKHELFGSSEASDYQLFMEVLSLCHTVVIEEAEEASPGSRSSEDVIYQAESPDEGTLVGAAADLGYKLVERTNKGMFLRVGDPGKGSAKEKVFYEEIALNEFDSKRKRMSVMVRRPDGSAILICKGADSAMLRVAKPNPTDQEAKMIRKMSFHIDSFARLGLRTLILGYKLFSAAELDAWMQQYNEAKSSVVDRDAKISAAADAAEQNLTLIGATAIEDKLQDGVVDTIETLLAAGIKIWVLTGDKTETAIEIGKSCGLLQAYMDVKVLRGGPEREVMEELVELYHELGAQAAGDKKLLDAVEEELRQFRTDGGASEAKSGSEVEGAGPASGPTGLVAFVMEGFALEHVFVNDARKSILFSVAAKATAVVACRATPGQKALLVETVQTFVKPKPVTLAVGDGANDVGMIQKAQVGIGIAGLEGQQAVNASDFAIAQFKYLKRLLLIHGRWNYRRMAVVILYSFYKNFVLVAVLFFYGFDSEFSGLVLFDQWLYSLYNFYTTLPAIAVGIFEKDVPEEYVYAHPEIYRTGRLNKDMSTKKIVYWVVTALVHGAIVYYIPRGAYAMQTDGGVGQGFVVWGTTIFTALVTAMNVRILEHTRTIVYFRKTIFKLCEPAAVWARHQWCSTISGWTISLWVFSMGLLFLTYAAYSDFDISLVFGELNFFNVGLEVVERAETYAHFFLVPAACIVADSTYPWAIRFFFAPTKNMVAIERAKIEQAEKLAREASANVELQVRPGVNHAVERAYSEEEPVLAARS